MTDRFISVIVPTYQDWDRLALCIEALSKQSYPRECFEVIIVNNDPNDPVPLHFSLPEGFRIITEAKVGSYAARNAGLREAKGSIIGFTDTDCVPDPAWIENAVTYFHNNSHCSRIAGHIDIFHKGAKATIVEQYNAIFAFPQESHASGGTCVTGNLFTYKHVFDAVGPFDETLLSLGDLQWGKRAHKAGFQIRYVPNVIVKHPARTLQELIKKEKRVGGGQGSMGERSKAQDLWSCVTDIRPRPGLLKTIYRNSKGINMIDQFQIFLLRHYLISVRALEKFRVLWGKQPQRA
jgi:GT2 family glycosyltransferase